MVKLKHLKAHKRNSSPDHIVQEVDDLITNMANALSPVLLDVEPNVILSAFNRLHAGMIVVLISEKEEELINAVKCELAGLIGNVEDIANIEIFKGNI